MKIRLLSGVVIKNKPGVKVGDVVEVSYTEAMELTGPGFAEIYVEPEVKAAPEVVQVREPEVEHRDPGFVSTDAPKLGRKRR